MVQKIILLPCLSTCNALFSTQNTKHKTAAPSYVQLLPRPRWCLLQRSNQRLVHVVVTIHVILVFEVINL